MTPPHASVDKYFYRTADLTASLLGLALTSPIMLLICLINLFYTGSPLFFQQRVGRNQQPFTIVKFRTMPKDTRHVGTHLVDAASLSPMGKFLRRSKLDELPQLVNVLLGHMSLVGPRPCLPSQSELITERAKRDVFRMRPGITGYAQISNVDMSTPRKLARYDALMNRNLTPCLYVALIVQTLSGKGKGDRTR